MPPSRLKGIAAGLGLLSLLACSPTQEAGEQALASDPGDTAAVSRQMAIPQGMIDAFINGCVEHDLDTEAARETFARMGATAISDGMQELAGNRVYAFTRPRRKNFATKEQGKMQLRFDCSVAVFGPQPQIKYNTLIGPVAAQLEKKGATIKRDSNGRVEYITYLKNNHQIFIAEVPGVGQTPAKIDDHFEIHSLNLTAFEL